MEYEKTFHDFDGELDDNIYCGGCNELATQLISHEVYHRDDKGSATFTGIWSCEKHIEQAKQELVIDCGAPNGDDVRIVIQTMEEIEANY